jgi:hypothetical protein
VHRSQNRIESYHQLRAFLAEVSGKKHLTGRTDPDVAISNECGRLIANVVIAYNSILLSMLLNRRQTADTSGAAQEDFPGGVAACSLPGPLPVSRLPPPNRRGSHFSPCWIRLTY